MHNLPVAYRISPEYTKATLAWWDDRLVRVVSSTSSDERDGILVVPSVILSGYATEGSLVYRVKREDLKDAKLVRDDFYNNNVVFVEIPEEFRMEKTNCQKIIRRITWMDKLYMHVLALLVWAGVLSVPKQTRYIRDRAVTLEQRRREVATRSRSNRLGERAEALRHIATDLDPPRPAVE